MGGVGGRGLKKNTRCGQRDGDGANLGNGGLKRRGIVGVQTDITGNSGDGLHLFNFQDVP